MHVIGKRWTASLLLLIFLALHAEVEMRTPKDKSAIIKLGTNEAARVIWNLDPFLNDAGLLSPHRFSTRVLD